MSGIWNFVTSMWKTSHLLFELSFYSFIDHFNHSIILALHSISRQRLLPLRSQFLPLLLQNFHSDIESALQRGCYVLLIDVDLAMLKENKKLHEVLKAHDQFINADAPFKLTVRKLFNFQNCLSSVNVTF